MFSAVSLAVFVLLSGCAETEKNEESDDTDMLYAKTLRLSDIFTDSLKMAADSLEAGRMFERYMTLKDSLNNVVAPNTDLLFTEAENDTLYMKIMAVRKAYDDRLASLAVRYEYVDSIQPENQKND